MLELKNVRKGYGDFELDCTLSVKKGCVTGLIGANGAGKSTSFKAILNLIKKDGGEIRIFGKDVNSLSTADRQQIGVVLGGESFSGYLSIRQIIPVLKSMYTRFDKEYFLAECNSFRLPLNKKLKDFSTGMKARLGIIIALSHEASLLILDEPTAGLDVVARDNILDMLREYMESGERSILISSHISSDLEGFCDEIYMMHNGKIIVHEDTDVILGQYGVMKISSEQLDNINKKYVMYKKKESFGYTCLTNNRQFYQNNYPDIVMEKSGIDDFMLIIEKGEAL